MSRKRNPSHADQAYGLVVLECPWGHMVGKILRQPDGGYHDFAGDFRSLDPLAVRCEKCRAAGRKLDLRGSWPKIKAILDEIGPDPTRGPVTYVLG